MSAPSLASEIAQLHELYQLGALTEEEFNAAKQATLRAFLSKSGSGDSSLSPSAPADSTPSLGKTAMSLPTAPLETSPVQPPAEAAESPSTPVAAVSAPPPEAAPTPTPAAVRTRDEWQRLWSRSAVRLPAESSGTLIDFVDVRVQALRCAARVLRNIHANPAEAKYKRIREANRTIAHELLSVEASAAVLIFAGFIREAEGSSAPTATTTTAEKSPSSYVWVQRDEPAEAARKASAACRLVNHLLDYMGEQQARRYGVLQLWSSVALEVRLEQAARARAVSETKVLNLSKSDDNEEDTTAHPFLAYLVACYTVDEAGDGLYSSVQHLQTLQQMYEAQLPASTSDVPSPSQLSCLSPCTYSLLETAEVYGAVVQQRGAVELLLYGCDAQLHPCPAAAQRASSLPTSGTATTATTATPAPSPLSAPLYCIELLPSQAHNGVDAAAHMARCVKLLQRLQSEVERVRQQRAHAAREAAEKSMRQELRRERQRQQLEQSRVREELEADSQAQLRRARLQGAPQHHRTSSSASSSSSSLSGESPSHRKGREKAEAAQGRRRIPIAEALAILMGRKSPPLSRPPAA